MGEYAKIDRSRLTPAMQQYVDVKDQYPDCMILFRMGDFYETFYDDAILISQVLDITLTKRGTKNPVPLAGIPYHALDNYLHKLVKAGIKVGIVEQLEDPKQAKGVVKRGLVRIVTPGTIIESTMLTDKQNNFITAVVSNANNTQFALAVADLSTGEFRTTQLPVEKLENELTRIRPAEILISQTLQNQNLDSNVHLDFLKRARESRKQFFINPFHDRHFVLETAYQKLVENFKVLSLDCFSIEDKALCVQVSGALLAYLKETQKTALSHIKKIQYYSTDEFMILDKATIQNLEIVQNIRDKSNHGALISVLDQTVTPMGGRLLKKWVLHPLLQKDAIEKRYAGVGELKNNLLLRKDVIALLQNINDMERLISRINYGTANGRDLLSLKNSLLVIPELKNLFQSCNSELLKEIVNVKDFSMLVSRIELAIKDDPPVSIREGGFIKTGFNQELDELHDICKNGKTYIKNLEESEKEKTGIKSLKVGFNKVFGYYIEVTRTNSHLVPDSYVRKQTLANAERFITDDLKKYEEKILGAEEKINALEYELFIGLIKEIVEYTSAIQEASQVIAQLDILQSFATRAVSSEYVQPEIHDGFELELKDSRHPVIELLEETFIPNDVSLRGENRLMVITGPNMAGKSTVMRQVALITLLAQIGSFVPASSAKISIVDRIFTRVGAHDDLTHGQSTFMVEMNETSAILNNATSRSLIIMDEIGRGTSTYDGVAIAWSVAEHINNAIKAKTMFATHYHILTKLAEYEGVANYNIAVKESNDSIIFLRKLVAGGTDKSYGVHVAKLAGMPQQVIDRAREVQKGLESDDTMHEDVQVKDAPVNVREPITKPAVQEHKKEQYLEKYYRKSDERNKQKTLFDSL